MFLRHKKGQSTLEFAILIAAVVAGLIALQIYMKRGVSGKLKGGVDEIGEQYDPTQYTSSFTLNSGGTTRETVASKVTRSEITVDETNTKDGTEGTTAWSADEDMFKSY